jgi:hemolysin activation/secretion protein
VKDRQDQLLEEQFRRLEALKALSGELQTSTPPDPLTDSLCFPINTIELKGADSLSGFERERLTQPYLGQCLGVSQLNELLRGVTNLYIGRGLVTSRAYLPQQDVSKGDLQILVIEGRLETLRGDASSGFNDRELEMAFAGQEGQLLNLREIEQMVDQLNRLPSNHAHIEVTPGTQLGASDVVVKNTPDSPWRVNLSRSNDGQRGIGEQQWKTGLEWDSPLGLADQIILRGTQDAISDHRRASRTALLTYQFAWGWWRFRYSYSATRYRSFARVNAFKFNLSGSGQFHNLHTERVIHRDSLSKTSLTTGLFTQRADNYVEDSHIAVSSYRLTEMQYGINHGRRLGSAFLNIDLGTQQGISALGAQDDNEPAPGQPDARYRKYTGTVTYLQPFKLWGERFSFSSLIHGQRSEDVLFSPQRLSVGGSSSVRGYKTQCFCGDSGGYWRNELRLTRPVTLEWLRPAFTEYGTAAGYDRGVIRNDRYNGDKHGRLSGNSFEFFARGPHVAATVAFARSLERPAGMVKRESPINFRMEFFL